MPKTYNNLFEKIVEKENILLAIKKAAKGKKHKSSVKYALRNINEVAERIQQELVSDSWSPPSIHKSRVINDGITLKKRSIVCPEFIREQCVHHAIMNICAPLFQKKFFQYSCGSIPTKGQEFVKDYLKYKINKYRYYCKLDIKKFFNSLKPSAVFKALRRTIRDRRVLHLFSKILRANKTFDINREITKGGILIGFFTSPWFANIVLTDLDHYAKEVLRIPIYVRYVDDILILGNNKRELQKSAKCIKDKLHSMDLELKYPISIHKIVVLRYLSWTFKNNTIGLRDKIFLRATRSCHRIKQLTIYNAIKLVTYAGRFKQTDAYKAFKKYFIISIRKCRRIISRRAKRNATA